jgi:hypothetical protein
MLRHIISVSLSVTACVTLIPTKVNAATLTVVPVGTLQRNPGDSIEFILAFNSQTPVGKQIRFILPDVLADPNELSAVSIDLNPNTPPGSIVDFTTSVARARFDVIRAIGDGLNDVSARILYQEIDLVSGEESEVKATLFAPGGDVVPVPEPLTIFGTATAFGCGVLFKRKSSKKTVS